jgi:uncharacterized SAM-binding protein YcdF (DUF218 family)
VAVAAATVAAALAAAFATALILVLRPPAAERRSADAVFVHAGGRGERVDTALALMAEGTAPVLVVSVADRRLPPGDTVPCTAPVDFEVVCLVPETDDTAGEARALAGVVEAEGWDEVAVITTDYHLRRAAFLDRACTGVTIHPIPAEGTVSGPNRLQTVAEEAAGLVVSWLVRPC